MSQEKKSNEDVIVKLQHLLKSGKRTLNHYPLLLESALIVKEACAAANGEVGAISQDKARLIESVCQSLRQNIKAVDCPININRSLGAPLNLAVAELIVREASKQSKTLTFEDILTNQADADVTATVKVLTVAKAIEPLLEAGFDFIDLMKTKAQEFNDVVKTSRASLRDGLPVCLGDEFEGYACTMKEALGRLSTERSLWKVSALGLGEAGTGLGSTRAFQIKANEALSRISGIKFEEPHNAFLALDGAHNLVLAHAHLQAIALVLWRTGHDLGLMCSGPRGGIREIAFPAVAPGSSIMPGKVNPTVAELAMLVADNVLSNSWAATLSVHSGWLGTTPTSSLALRTFMDSTELLTRTLHVFGEKVIQGITAYPERCLKQAQSSLALVHALDYFVDKEDREKVLNKASSEDLSIIQAAKILHVLPDSVLDDVLDPKHLINREAVESMLKRHTAILK